MNPSNASGALEQLQPDREAAAPTVEAEAARTYPFDFRGTGSEYFRIWIVNLLLTILTLGIFSAWAKVRRQRYFYGNTFLDGHPFEYHAHPVAILKGRVIVFLGYVAFFVGMQFYPVLLYALIPIAALGLPWILMRSRRFQLRMTSWRNVHFGFRGKYGSAVNAYIGWHLSAVVVLLLFVLLNPKPAFLVFALAILAILYPKWVHKRVEYTLDNADYGRECFSFLTGSERFYLICGVTAVISVAALVGFVYALIDLGIVNARTRIGNPDLIDQLVEAGPKGWASLVVAGVVAFGIAGMYRAWFVNASYGGVMIRLHTLTSRVGVFRLMWIKMTNLLGILLTLGLYYPFAKVRQVRYQLSCMTLVGSGQFDEIQAEETSGTDALGEEAGDFFNVDLGL